MENEIRMDAYYYNFSKTGVPEIDLILSAVACAGKAHHHTNCWGDESFAYPPHEGKAPADWIQNAANKAATAWNTRPQPDIKPDAAEALGACNWLTEYHTDWREPTPEPHLSIIREKIETIKTALQIAAPNPNAVGAFDIIKFLLDQGAIVNRAEGLRLLRGGGLFLNIGKKRAFPITEADLQNAGAQWQDRIPTNKMIEAGLEESLKIMKEHGVDGLSPFADYPAPTLIIRRVFEAMIAAGPTPNAEGE